MSDTLTVARRVLRQFDQDTQSAAGSSAVDTDDAIALRMQRDDLREFLAIYDDFQFARTLSVDDGDTNSIALLDTQMNGILSMISEHLQMIEEQQLARILPVERAAPPVIVLDWLDDEGDEEEVQQDLFIAAPVLLAPPARARSMTPAYNPADFGRKCTSCAASVEDEPHFTAPCGHTFCVDCLCAYITASLPTESLIPVRCCKSPFPTATLNPVLPHNLRTQYRAKLDEYGASPNARVYCPNPRCSVFLGTTNTIASCHTCRERICVRCKRSTHTGPCPANALQVDVLFIDLTKEQQWQMCYRCHRTVERIDGCPHIVCTCGAEFCYLCGSQWGKVHSGGCTASG